MSAPKVDVLAVPAAFFDDHAGRALPTPGVIRRTGARVYVRADDPAIADLRSGAEYYANRDNMDECPRYVRDSAQRTVEALARAGAAP